MAAAAPGWEAEVVLAGDTAGVTADDPGVLSSAPILSPFPFKMQRIAAALATALRVARVLGLK
jgi:hypothetical protein